VVAAEYLAEREAVPLLMVPEPPLAGIQVPIPVELEVSTYPADGVVVSLNPVIVVVPETSSTEVGTADPMPTFEPTPVITAEPEPTVTEDDALRVPWMSRVAPGVAELTPTLPDTIITLDGPRVPTPIY